MMRVWCLVIILYGTVNCQDDLDSLINQIFGVGPDAADQNSVDIISKCEAVEGRAGSGCYECYQCDHSTIAFQRSRGQQIHTLRLNNASCVAAEVCCVSQAVAVGLRMRGDCGPHNKDGAPGRRIRKSARDSLQGEYPWTAYVYRKANGRLDLLCGASLIDDGQKALVTAARCLKGLSAESIAVSFIRSPTLRQTSSVKEILVHEQFSGKVGGRNDIAIIILESLDLVPRWARPVCLPDSPAPPAATCVTLSDNHVAINTVLPLQTACGDLDRSQICAFTAPGDYLPQHGAAFFCQIQGETVPQYVLYGISSSPQNDVSIYTDIVHFSKWIHNKLYN